MLCGEVGGLLRVGGEVDQLARAGDVRGFGVMRVDVAEQLPVALADGPAGDLRAVGREGEQRADRVGVQMEWT